VHFCLRDPTFSRFDTVPECDRHTHTHRLTDRHDDGIFLARIASRGKNQQDRQMGIDKVQSVSATSLW